nr:hypothetical protein [Burkholderia sp. THE68]
MSEQNDGFDFSFEDQMTDERGPFLAGAAIVNRGRIPVEDRIPTIEVDLGDTRAQSGQAKSEPSKKRAVRALEQ